MMDEAYPQLVAQVVPAPLMGFFAAVMLGAILSSFNSVLNSVDTMFTMDIYAEFIDQNASEEKLVKVGKNVGIIFAVLTTIVGPLIYFFPAGLKTFLDRAAGPDGGIRRLLLQVSAEIQCQGRSGYSRSLLRLVPAVPRR